MVMDLAAMLHRLVLLVVLVLGPAGFARAQNAGAPQPKGFVVAFGLSDELNVFHSEATRAAAILVKSYGGGAPPLVYTNRPRARHATVENLRTALAQTAARMDRDNDVLFLFLTSHGTKDGVVLQSGRRVAVLTPAQLAALLRETGVRNKVVIISACYSGVFLPLADPGTLVMTAADAAHPSFGCEKAATWTFFGRALFSQAIPKTNNLRDAFVVARSAVLARETREGYEPSNPQMAGGQNFSARLRAVRAQEMSR
jgi:Peptidase C13 family